MGIHTTLSAQRFMPGAGEVISHQVIVAHLRMNIHAAQGLRMAIDKALGMAAKAQMPQTKH
jgi:hypothetical protein